MSAVGWFLILSSDIPVDFHERILGMLLLKNWSCLNHTNIK